MLVNEKQENVMLLKEKVFGKIATPFGIRLRSNEQLLTKCDVMMHDIKNFIFAKLRDLIA